MSEEKQDYGKTLNLPKTDFPMRASLPENEPKIQERVFDKGLYEKILKKNEGNEPFVLHDGPPYANGEIHIGHALNKVLKDTIVRYKNLQGFYTPFIPGYDTHGMPTEKKAIEKLGLNRDAIPVTQFRDTCKQFTVEYKDKQIEGFKRLGVLADWKDPYITYQPQMEAKQIGVFATMYNTRPVSFYLCQGVLFSAINPDDQTTTTLFRIEDVRDDGVILRLLIPGDEVICTNYTVILNLDCACGMQCFAPICCDECMRSCGV
mgnify:CR=1 FL=1